MNKIIKNIIVLIVLTLLVGCGNSSGESSSFHITPPNIKGKDIYFVEENTREAFQIEATDNSSIKYYLSGTDAPLLYVDIITGEIFFNEPTDFETKRTYNFTIIIEDSVGNRSSKDVIIQVKDDPNEDIIVATEHNNSLSGMEDKYFITIWQTNNHGTSANNQITIPTIGDGYNYNVDWGDGTSSKNLTVDATHTYNKVGTYKIKITGDFPRICFNKPNTDRNKLLSVEQWGDNVWSTMADSFSGCSNLQINSSDTPNLSKVKSTYNMFAYTSSFNQDISSWDFSNVQNMGWMFHHAYSFNQDISSWNVSKVTNMEGMFNHAYSFNQDLSSWNVSNVTNMAYMFTHAKAFNQDLSSWNVSKVKDMQFMFEGASNLANRDFSSWNITIDIKYEGFANNTGKGNIEPNWHNNITIDIEKALKTWVQNNKTFHEKPAELKKNPIISRDKTRAIIFLPNEEHVSDYAIFLDISVLSDIKELNNLKVSGYKNNRVNFRKIKANDYVLFSTYGYLLIYDYNTGELLSRQEIEGVHPLTIDRVENNYAIVSRDMPYHDESVIYKVDFTDRRNPVVIPIANNELTLDYKIRLFVLRNPLYRTDIPVNVQGRPIYSNDKTRSVTTIEQKYGHAYVYLDVSDHENIKELLFTGKASLDNSIHFHEMKEGDYILFSTKEHLLLYNYYTGDLLSRTKIEGINYLEVNNLYNDHAIVSRNLSKEKRVIYKVDFTDRRHPITTIIRELIW